MLGAVVCRVRVVRELSPASGRRFAKFCQPLNGWQTVRMTDQPGGRPLSRDEALAKVMASDLPEKHKARIIQHLIVEAERLEQSLQATADRMIADAEQLLREQGT